MFDNHLTSTATEDSDELLMSRFQDGDEDAFHVVFNRYFPRIINFANRFLQSQEESEDLTQNVFLRIYKKRLSYNSQLRFRPWLYAITSRLISNKIRDKKRHPHESMDEILTADDGSEFTDEKKLAIQPRESDSSEKEELTRSVRSALQSLPENQRTAVILARYEELSYEEIAQTMDISLSSVTSLLFRARQTLKKVLSEFAPR